MSGDPLTDPEGAVAFLKRAHVYRPHNDLYCVSLVQTCDGKNKGKPLCRSAVHGLAGFHQCPNPGVEQTADQDGHWWCRVHGPSGVARRAEITAAKDKSAAERRAEMRRRSLDNNPHVQALLAIAKGDNDPRTTARDALGTLWFELGGEE